MTPKSSKHIEEIHSQVWYQELDIEKFTTKINKLMIEARIEELENLANVKNQPGIYFGDIVLDTLKSRLIQLQATLIKQGDR